MYKVLVANRGEIAIRIIRSARELGWLTVTVYTDGDESHATFADEVVKLDGVADYLNVDKLSDIAQRAQCTHLHPGYGFLSESSALAMALPDSIVFIGPSAQTLRIASDKLSARDLAKSLGVNIAPGCKVSSKGDVQSFAHVEGFPVIIKALDGGGGRGIRIVESDNDAEDAFKRCLGESPSRQLFVEKAVIGPGWKHIEIQIIGDGSGGVAHLWERECSVQRRFQKIIEFAPSRLPPIVIQPLIEASIEMAKHLRYWGLGTFEYLVNSRSLDWIFLEINPRIQVEHTVTEEVMGIDLVRTQLLLFIPSTTLESLDLVDPPIRPRGYAIQLRLTAENPSNSFQLSTGTIKPLDVVWPSGHGIRVDTWLSMGPSAEIDYPGWTIDTDFDSLLAKVIVRGKSFEETTQRARNAIREVQVGASVSTNRDVLAGVLGHPDWLSSSLDTLWLEQNISDVLALGKHVMKPARSLKNFHKSPSQSITGSHIPTPSGVSLLQPGTLFHLTLSPSSNSLAPPAKHSLVLSSISQNSFPSRLSGVIQTSLSTTALTFSLSQSTSAAFSSAAFDFANPNDPSHIASPFTGKIIELHPALLDAQDPANQYQRLVKKGETVIVFSIMKMESVIIAPYDAYVQQLGRGIQNGVVVGEGMLICVLDRSPRFTETSKL